MDSARKKELRSAYKTKQFIGGICSIRCSGNQRILLQSTVDIDSLKNRFDFAMSTRCCPDPSLRAEWEKYGSDSFTFEVLEQIKKNEDQSDREFRDDIDTLYDIWVENTNFKSEGDKA